MKKGESIYFPLGKHFLNKEEVKYIEKSLKEFPLEYISIGDAGEINNCQVGRLMEDQPQSFPKKLNDKLSIPILELYKTPKAKKFFSEIHSQSIFL